MSLLLRRTTVVAVTLVVGLTAGCGTGTGHPTGPPSTGTPAQSSAPATRPAATLIPATVRSLSVSFQPGLNGPDPATRYGQLTVTDPAQVTAVVAAVNALPVEPAGGARPCPAPRAHLEMWFRSETGGQVAHAQASLDGCDDIYLEVGTTRTVLSGAGNLTRSIVATLHLPWGPVP